PGITLTWVAEAAPQRRNVDRCHDRGAGRLVEDLETLVHDLDVLREADFSVRVGRRAVAADAGEWDAVEVEDRRRHPRSRNGFLLDSVRGVHVGATGFRVRTGLV